VLLDKVVVCSYPVQILGDVSVNAVASHEAGVALILPSRAVRASVIVVRFLSPKAAHKVDRMVAALLTAECGAFGMWRVRAAVQIQHSDRVTHVRELQLVRHDSVILKELDQAAGACPVCTIRVAAYHDRRLKVRRVYEYARVAAKDVAKKLELYTPRQLCKRAPTP
jgi:hypothetical protein